MTTCFTKIGIPISATRDLVAKIGIPISANRDFRSTFCVRPRDFFAKIGIPISANRDFKKNRDPNFGKSGFFAKIGIPMTLQANEGITLQINLKKICPKIPDPKILHVFELSKNFRAETCWHHCRVSPMLKGHLKQKVLVPGHPQECSFTSLPPSNSLILVAVKSLERMETWSLGKNSLNTWKMP